MTDFVRRLDGGRSAGSGLLPVSLSAAKDPSQHLFRGFCVNLVKLALTDIYPLIWSTLDRAHIWRDYGIKRQRLENLQDKHRDVPNSKSKYFAEFEIEFKLGEKLAPDMKSEFYAYRDKNGVCYTSLDVMLNRSVMDFVKSALPRQIVDDVEYKTAGGLKEALPPSKKFCVVVEPIDYKNGLIRAILNGEEAESSTTVSILYNGVPIVGAIIGHNGDIVITDGCEVHRLKAKRVINDDKEVSIEVRREEHVGKFALKFKPDETPSVILVSKRASRNLQMYEDSMQLQLLLEHQFGPKVTVMGATGPRRVMTMLEASDSPNTHAIALSGAGINPCSVSATMAIIYALDGKVMVPSGYGLDFFGGKDIPPFYYGSGPILDDLCMSNAGLDLTPAFTNAQLEQVKLMATQRMGMQNVIPEKSDYRLDRARSVFYKEGYESLLAVGQYLLEVKRNLIEAGNNGNTSFMSATTVAFPRQFYAAETSILVTKKSDQDVKAQKVTTVDVSADYLLTEKPLSQGMSLDEACRNKGIFLISEEGRRFSDKYLQTMEFVAAGDGVDNTGAFYEDACLRLKIPDLYTGKPVISHPSREQVTVNLALFRHGQPIEGILLCPYRGSPAIFRTEIDEKIGNQIVTKVSLVNGEAKPGRDGGRMSMPPAEHKELSTLLCKIGYSETHRECVEDAFNYMGKFTPQLEKSSGQERITALFEKNVHLVFNDCMMSWDIGASVAMARALGYDVAILPQNMDDENEKSQPLDFRTFQKMPATVIGHPQHLRDMGLVPQMDLARVRERLHWSRE